MTVDPRLRVTLRVIALGYLILLLALPVAMIVYRTFGDGIGPVIDSLTSPEAQHAFYLTFVMVLIAVPANTVFGVACAIVIVRHRFRGRAILNALIDLPFAVSPVVVGLALVLVYSTREGQGWIGPQLAEVGIRVLFTPTGMALATIFVSLPFVVREVVPVLQEIGTEQEQAASVLGASPWQAFRRITLPAIRWGLGYGVVLATARSLGEYGALSIVSGKLSGQTETLTLRVEERFQRFDLVGAYSASLLLAVMAIGTLLLMTRLNPERKST